MAEHPRLFKARLDAKIEKLRAEQREKQRQLQRNAPELDEAANQRAEEVIASLETQILEYASAHEPGGAIHVMELTDADLADSFLKGGWAREADPERLIGAAKKVYEFCKEAELKPLVFCTKHDTVTNKNGYNILICVP